MLKIKSVFYITTTWIFQYSSSHHYDYPQWNYEDELPAQRDYYQPPAGAYPHEGVDDIIDYENFYPRPKRRINKIFTTGGGMLPLVSDEDENESSYRHYARDEYSERYERSRTYDCKCSCKKCKRIPKPCCQPLCDTCPEDQDDGSNVPYPQQSLLLVPYPYPLVIHAPGGLQPDPTPSQPNDSSTTTTTPETTTTTTTPETTTISTKPNTTYNMENTTTTTENNIELPEKDEQKSLLRLREMGSFAMTKVRPLRQNRPSRYGLVPIPDALATKLMLQMRDMTGIQRRNQRRHYRDY